MSRRLATCATLGLVAICALAVVAATPAPVSTQPERTGGMEVSFSEQILPIFERSCTSCHGGVDANGERRAEEELDLSSYDGVMAGSAYGTVVEPGDADASVLVDMVSAGDMPSQDDGPVDPLTPEEIELIRTWINEGAANN